MGKDSDPVRLKVVSGGLVEVPIWEQSKRGKNWAAVIGGDPRMPGGLSRKFLDYGRGDFYYTLGDLSLFDAVEFAADYVSYSGNVTQNRWFGVVVAKAEGFIEVLRFERGIDAVTASAEMRSDPGAKRGALRRELEYHQSRAAELEAKLHGA